MDSFTDLKFPKKKKDKDLPYRFKVRCLKPKDK